MNITEKEAALVSCVRESRHTLMELYSEAALTVRQRDLLSVVITRLGDKSSVYHGEAFWNIISEEDIDAIQKRSAKKKIRRNGRRGQDDSTGV